MSDRSRPAAIPRDGGRGTRGAIQVDLSHQEASNYAKSILQQDVRPLQTARPLTREESREYNLDISERFYDDYHHSRRNS